MTDYTKLVKALRCCDKYALCNDCPIFETCDGDVDKAMAIAAAAIEALQAQLPKRGQYVHGRELSREYVGDCLVSIDYEDWRCSVCGIVFEQWSIPKYNYCPNCGAKMEVHG